MHLLPEKINAGKKVHVINNHMPKAYKLIKMKQQAYNIKKKNKEINKNTDQIKTRLVLLNSTSTVFKIRRSVKISVAELFHLSLQGK